VQPYITLLGEEGSEGQVTTEKTTRQELKRANRRFARNSRVVENPQI